MKNVTYLLFFTGLIFASCEGSDEVGITEYVLSSDTQYIHANSGTDSSAIISSYTYDQGKLTISSYTYDQGKLTKIELYTPGADQPTGMQEYYYDENGQLLKSYAVSYIKKSRDKYQEVFYSFVYNEQGSIASKIIDSLIYYVWPDTLRNIEQVDYEYDEQQRLISIHTHFAQADLGVFRFYYDSQSNLIKEEHYSHADDNEPSYFIEFKSFDTHPNPFYTFMQTINIPYHTVGYRYAPRNVLEEESFLFINSQKTTTVYEYEYSTEHDYPVKIYANGKLKHEFTYEKLN